MHPPYHPFLTEDGPALKISPFAGRTAFSETEPERFRSEVHAIYRTLTGEAIWEIDFNELSLQASQIIIIPKGAVFREISNQQLSGHAILFRDDFFSMVQKQLLNGFMQSAVALRKLQFPLTAEASEHLSLYIELLLRELSEIDNQNRTFILQNLMLALLNKLEGLAHSKYGSPSFITTRSHFQLFVELVEAHFIQHKNLDFYTTRLKLTDRKLNDVLKQMIGQTASNFIIDRIMVEAKRELCFSEKSVKEIAFLLGYESQYYFSRLFKKRTGLSPEQFRSQFSE